MKRVRIGISTCPNDTYAFHGLLTGAVRAPGLALEFELRDVEELNRGFVDGRYDVAKVSFHLALQHAADLWVLESGSALGFGNGPLLLAAPDTPGRPGPGSRVWCPGAHTTAALLYRLFHPSGAAPQHAVFSAIMPALARGAADFGVCIHEGRFTYREAGLRLVEDLGSVWERATGAPLPLGGIVARRAVGEDVARRVQAGLAASLAQARARPEATLPTLRAHAAELDDAVLWQHVELYVNEHTERLGAVGRRALATLAERALAAGIAAAPLAVLDPPAGRGAPVHVVPRELYAAHTWASPWAPPSFAREGFLHLSYEDQLAGTLAAHFRGAGEVAVLELDAERVNDALVLEPSRDGALFPHLYRPLARADVRAVRFCGAP